MPSFEEVVEELQESLGERGGGLQETEVSVQFADPIFANQIVAIPDVHLCDARGGDIFLEGKPERAQKLAGGAATGAVGRTGIPGGRGGAGIPGGRNAAGEGNGVAGVMGAGAA